MEQGVREQADVNQEQTDAWDGVLFDAWIKYRDLVCDGLALHGDAALRIHPPRQGDSVIDLGCGLGDTTQQIAELVGPQGHAFGVDVGPRFIEAAQQEAEDAGNDRVSFAVADIQTDDLGGPYDYAYSRMGIMFFDSPVAALRNVREALVPGGRLSAAVWRRKLDNDWLHRAEQVVEKYLDEPEEHDVPTCGPGPFSMANADTVSEQLGIAGFEDVSLTRCDAPIKIGNSVDHAIEFAMALGPAAEVLRVCPPEEVEEVRPQVVADLREALTDFVQEDGTVAAPASTWIVGARNPG